MRMNPAEEYVDARLKQAIGDCFTWKDGLPLMKKQPKNARYITIDRMSQPMAAVPLKDLPGATKNMTLAPQQTMVPYVRDKLFSCEEKRLCLGGFYISNDGSHVVGLAMLGSLLYFGETTQPMTSMSPLRMSAKSINSSFAGLDMAWMHAVIESLVAMNTVKASGDAGLLKPNPY